MRLKKNVEDPMDSAEHKQVDRIKELEEPARLSVSCEKRIMGYFGHVARKGHFLRSSTWLKRERKISYQIGQNNELLRTFASSIDDTMTRLRIHADK